jgi:prolyl oligopeptidase
MATFKASYPVARRDEVVDDLFGTKVPDPYRWLENPKSNETQVPIRISITN